MGVKQLSDGGTDGTALGQDADDLVGFHGATPSDQAAAVTLATGATIADVVTAVQAIAAALTEKGLTA
jgi:hypothetical protein